MVSKTYLFFLLLLYFPLVFADTPNLKEREILLSISVNDKEISVGARCIVTADNRIQVPESIFTNARLKFPGEKSRENPIRHHDETYYFINDIRSAKINIDLATQSLNITVPSEAFVETDYDLTDLSGRRGSIASHLGGFLNYDLEYSRYSGMNSLASMFELGIFDGKGTFTSRFVARDDAGTRSGYRLDSQYTRDFPEDMSVLVIGDSITTDSPFSRQYYFAGVQWKTKFATNPNYQYLPLPVLKGTAAAPSVVDIYVDNMLRIRQNVDTGPFAINNLPVLTGQGNVQMVVKDLLGRQQVYSQSYITGTQLLRAGALDYSLESGFLHNDFGTRDNSYGRLFSSATARYGYTDKLTIQGSANVMRDKETLGLALTYALSNVGLISVGRALSHSTISNDSLGFIQFDKQTLSNSFSARVQTTGKNFWQNSPADMDLASALELQLQESITLTRAVSFSLGYFKQRNRDRPDLTTLNGGFVFNFDDGSSLNIAVIKSISDTKDVSANAVLVIPLHHSRLLQLTASHQTGSRSLGGEYQQAAAPEGGWGYRLRQSIFDNQTTDIGANYLWEKGEYLVSANRAANQTNVNGTARGSFAYIDGHAVATRWINDSFGIVEVPTDEPVDIYANNHWVGKTKNGIGFIPSLIPYEDNKIYLQGDALPLKMTLELDERYVSPSSRSGVLLKFNARESNGATIILKNDKGQFLPTGTLVTMTGADQMSAVSVVALRGRVFFPEIKFPANLRVDNSKINCNLDLQAPVTSASLPILGPYICGSTSK